MSTGFPTSAGGDATRWAPDGRGVGTPLGADAQPPAPEDAKPAGPDLAAMQAAVAKQGDEVRALKARKNEVPKEEIDAAVKELVRMKAELDAAVKEAAAAGEAAAKEKEVFRNKMGTVLQHRLFYMPSYGIYGGVAGFYDYGPPGCAIKANLTNYWKKHFILEEAMLELECPAVTPEVVLQASGHVERFTDMMVKDVKTGDCYRADHLLEAVIETKLLDPMLSADEKKRAIDVKTRVDELNEKELGAELKYYGVKAPDTKNDITEPYPFNLMFATQIGPSGMAQGYLRPETAQGMFTNFRELLYFNGNKLPFAAAQVGQSYRNEISPRQGLLRVREFTQAEIEHFVHPDRKDHPKFASVANVVLNLYSQSAQMGDEKKPFKMAVGEAVKKGIIDNETLGYFIARTHLFLIALGINSERLRFRQHLKHEMAHYAKDCWDAEIECSYGWMECVGLADRSAYDLNAHSAKSKVPLVAFEPYDKPKMLEVVVVEPNKKELGKAFKKDAKAVTDALAALSEADALALQAKLESAGEADVGGFSIKASMVAIKQTTKKVTGDTYTPSVIEPSFGIGRILYCLFEHCFYVREDDENKIVFAFPPLVAPIKTTLFPLSNDARLDPFVQELNRSVTREGLSCKVDTTGASIGRRYARTDELGVPFAITIDFDTLQDRTVTVRERDTCSQVRVPVADVPGVLAALCSDLDPTTWKDVAAKYPAAKAPADDK